MLEAWPRSHRSILIQGEELSVDDTCVVIIQSLDDEMCKVSVSTEPVVVSSVTLTISSFIITLMAVLITSVLATVAMVIAIMRCKNLK